MSMSMTMKSASAVAGSLGYPSKMPGTSYGIPASACNVGTKLHKIPGSTCHDCYALKGNYVFKGVKASQEARLAAITHPRWEEAMVAMLRKAHGLTDGKPTKGVSVGWHRWHDSGDLQSVHHLTRIVAICNATPEIDHWLPTREVGILTAFLKAGGVIPANLTVRVSATMVDGPASKAFPLVSLVHHKAAPAADAYVCPAPSQGNECGACRACWSRDVAAVSYHKH